MVICGLQMVFNSYVIIFGCLVYPWLSITSDPWLTLVYTWLSMVILA